MGDFFNQTVFNPKDAVGVFEDSMIVGHHHRGSAGLFADFVGAIAAVFFCKLLLG